MSDELVATRRIFGLRAPPKVRKLCIGIDVGPKLVRIAQVGEVDGIPAMVRGTTLPRPADDDALSLAIRSALTTHEMSGKDGAFLWSDSEATGPVYHVFLELPPMSAKERGLVAKRELEKSAGTGLLTYAIEDTRLTPRGSKLSKHLAIAVADNAVNRACQILSGARLNPRAVLTAADALRGLKRMAPGLPSPVAQAVIALVQCNAARGLVGIFEGDLLVFWREFDASLPGGEGRDDNDGQSVPTEEAGPAEIADPTALRFVDEIERSLAYFAQQHRPNRAEAVFISGPPELAEEICATLGSTYPCERLPGRGMVADPGEYGLAAGLATAVRYLKPANFTPAYLRQRPEVHLLLGTGSLAMVAALLLGFSLEAGMSSRYDAAKAKLAELQVQYDALSLVRQAREALERVHQAQALWQTVLARMDQYYDRWIELGLVLSAAAPKEAVYQDLRIQRTGELYSANVNALVKSKDMRAVQTAVTQISLGLGRLPTLQNIHVVGSESQREKDGSVSVKVQITFDFTTRPPVGT